MRWKLRNELEIREMRWRVDQGHVSLIHGISSVLRVEKGHVSLIHGILSVLRVEKGPCKLDFRIFKCAKS